MYIKTTHLFRWTHRVSNCNEGIYQSYANVYETFHAIGYKGMLIFLRETAVNI